MAISKDFFESVLPNPELSGDDDDFPDKLLWGECLSSCLGGTNFLIFITLSTILVPTRAGLTLSFALACNRFAADTGTELPLLCITPLGGRPLDGEHDCRLPFPLKMGSMDDDRELGAPGLPLLAEGGRSDIDVLKFGGASSENPGISEGFHILGLTVGELDRAEAGFFETGFETEEEVGDFKAGVLVPLVGLRVGVDDLNVDFDAGRVGPVPLVGVEDLIVDLEVRVEDLEGTVVGFDKDNVGRGVGVEDLDGFDVAVGVSLDDVIEVGLAGADNVGLFDDEDKVDRDVEVTVGRPVGVAGLEPPEEDGLRTPPLEVFSPGDDDDDGGLDGKLLLEVGSGWELDSYIHREFQIN
ncbi:hypothetical protein OROGR_022649 [Orobanche gracilis]